MKISLLILILSLSCVNSFASIILPGGNLTEAYSSEATNSAGTPLLKTEAGAGFNFEYELPIFSSFFLSTSAIWTQASGISQYNLIKSNLTATDLKTRATHFTGLIGPRLRLINAKKFKFFIGGGVSAGRFNLNFSESDFKSKHGASTSYKDEEWTSTSGTYWEIGTDFILSKKSAMRISFRQSNFQSDSFATLGSQKIKSDFVQFNLYYMHWFDWKMIKSK